MSDTQRYQVGVIMESAPAFDCYYDATGKPPPKIPDGCNTMSVEFTVRDEGGTERAALLMMQRGFEQTPEEKARGDEVNGLMVAIALDAPDIETGAGYLRTYEDFLLRDRDDVRIVKVIDHRKEDGQ